MYSFEMLGQRHTKWYEDCSLSCEIMGMVFTMVSELWVNLFQTQANYGHTV